MNIVKNNYIGGGKNKGIILLKFIGKQSKIGS